MTDTPVRTAPRARRRARAGAGDLALRSARDQDLGRHGRRGRSRSRSPAPATSSAPGTRAVNGLSSGTVWVIANKRSFAIDVKQKAALDILKRLAARSDVFLENFAPGCRRAHGPRREGADRGQSAPDLLLAVGLRPGRTLSRREGLRRADPGRVRDDRDDRLSRRAGQGRRVDDRSLLVDVRGGRDPARALSAREDGRGPGDRHLDVRDPRPHGSAISRITTGIAAKNRCGSACAINTSRRTDPISRATANMWASPARARPIGRSSATM